MASCLKPSNEKATSNGAWKKTGGSGDWMMMHQDLWKVGSDELVFPPNSGCGVGVKRARSGNGNTFSTSDFLLSLVAGGEQEQNPAFSSSDIMGIIPGDKKGKWEQQHQQQQSMKAQPTFSVPSYSSFPVSALSAFGINSKPNSKSDPLLRGGKSNGTTDWNQMFFDLMKDPAEPEYSTSTSSIPTETPQNVTSLPGGESMGGKLKAKKSTRKQPKPKKQQQQRQTKEYVLEPSENDVLLGRGGRSNHHKGNKIYRQLVEDLKIWYKDCPKAEKTKMSQCLVDKIQKEYNGRFLERAPGGGGDGKWYIITNLAARRKVSQALRDDNSPEFRAQKRKKYSKPFMRDDNNTPEVQEEETEVHEV